MLSQIFTVNNYLYYEKQKNNAVKNPGGTLNCKVKLNKDIYSLLVFHYLILQRNKFKFSKIPSTSNVCVIFRIQIQRSHFNRIPETIPTIPIKLTYNVTHLFDIPEGRKIMRKKKYPLCRLITLFT